jgi:DNA-binding NtrC family response regulator
MMKQHILAIDDELDMLKLLERIITEKTPYRITTTNNSLEVEQLLEETQFDLIITDLKMPGMDGMDVLRLVKEKKRYEEVIILTAFGSMESAIQALSLGVFDYINRTMRWQKLKKEAAKIADIFAREPYDEACKEFEREYVRRLAKRAGEDKNAMAERSGLPVETLAAAMNAQEPGR